jgi:hypothetical protein
LWYLGVFTPISVEERTMGPYTLVYEEHIGSYNDVGFVFDKVYKNLLDDGIDTTLGMGLYYDDPKTTDESELRSEVGSLIDEVQAGVIDYAKYNVKTIGIDEYVVVSMPFVNTLSYFIGVIRAYPVLTKYTAEHGYSSADYSIELYMPDKTLYMFPIVK